MPREELKEIGNTAYMEKYFTKKFCKWTIGFKSRTEKEKKGSIF